MVAGGGLRGRSEAAAMEAYAAELAARPREGKWLLEEESTSTRENALFSLEMARQRPCAPMPTGPPLDW